MNEFVQYLYYDMKIYLDDLVHLLLLYIQDLQSQFTRNVRFWAMTTMSNTILAADKKI